MANPSDESSLGLFARLQKKRASFDFDYFKHATKSKLQRTGMRIQKRVQPIATAVVDSFRHPPPASPGSANVSSTAGIVPDSGAQPPTPAGSASSAVNAPSLAGSATVTSNVSNPVESSGTTPRGGRILNVLKRPWVWFKGLPPGCKVLVVFLLLATIGIAIGLVVHFTKKNDDETAPSRSATAAVITGWRIPVWREKPWNASAGETRFPPFCVTPYSDENITIHCHGMSNKTNIEKRSDPTIYAYMSSNNWTSVDDGMLTNLPNLVVLDLSENSLKSVSQNAFVNLTDLATLNLSNNKLETVHKNLLKTLASLANVDLSNNQIHTVDGTFFNGIAALTEVRLGHNAINSIDPKLFSDQRHLEVLMLETNQLTELKKGTFTTLNNSYARLDLSDNKITKIASGAFHQSSLLREVDLTGNPLECSAIYNLPEGIAELYSPCEARTMKPAPKLTTDVNECQESPCKEGEICVNTHGSFICKTEAKKNRNPRQEDNTLTTVVVACSVTVLIIAIIGGVAYKKRRGAHPIADLPPRASRSRSRSTVRKSSKKRQRSKRRKTPNKRIRRSTTGRSRKI